MFKFLKHTADIKIRVEGNSIEDIFKESINALNSFLKPKIKKNSFVKNIEIILPKNEYQELLIDFLSEVLAKTYIEKLIFSLKNISIDNYLKTILTGREFIALKREIKAITYHQAKLEKKGNKYIAEFIVDI